MKTLIAVPCMDSVPTPFCRSLAMLQKVGDCAISFQVSSLIYTARDNLARKAVDMGADQILWLDSDMVFNPDLMEQLLKVKEKDTIVSGLYYRRAAPYTPVAFSRLDIDEEGAEFEHLTEVPDEPFEVAGVGFGCVLMPTEAVVAVTLNYRQLFNPLKGAGEDLSFCWRARKSGYKIICDPRIPLGHVAHTVVNADFYNAYKGAQT